MSTPEPLDEHPAGGVEIRGGDKPEDYIEDPELLKAWGGKLGSVYGTLGTTDPDEGCGSSICDCGIE